VRNGGSISSLLGSNRRGVFPPPSVIPMAEPSTSTRRSEPRERENNGPSHELGRQLSVQSEDSFAAEYTLNAQVVRAADDTRTSIGSISHVDSYRLPSFGDRKLSATLESPPSKLYASFSTLGSNESFRSSSDAGNSSSSRAYGQLRPQYSSASVIDKAAKMAAPEKTIEISPGHWVLLRGADETWECIERDFYVPCVCLECSMELCCIQDADFVICPICRVVSPMEVLEASLGNGGAGLGFTFDDLMRWQSEILMKRERSRQSGPSGYYR
jgi:hypothetical protein